MADDRPVLVVEFSGGETSAYMAYLIKKHPAFAGYRLIFVFCNTGKEDERTLEFVVKCDAAWDLGVIWLEAVIHPEENVGTTHKIVTFETAHRGKALFDAMCAKFGLPSKAYPHCTRELKQRPIESYMRSLGIPEFTEKRGSGYKKAVGMRADEPARVGSDPSFIYPLATMFPMTKPAIQTWWTKQPFSLGLPGFLGNCDVCWKKSKRKKLTIAKRHPEKLQDWIEMERDHARPEDDRVRMNERDRMFYRDYLTQAQKPFSEWRQEGDEAIQYTLDMDMESSCGCK